MLKMRGCLIQKQEVFYLRMKIVNFKVMPFEVKKKLDYWATLEENPRSEYSTQLLATLAISALLPHDKGN